MPSQAPEGANLRGAGLALPVGVMRRTMAADGCGHIRCWRVDGYGDASARRRPRMPNLAVRLAFLGFFGLDAAGSGILPKNATSELGILGTPGA